MVDKEIIKALECCGKNHIAGSTDACEHCFLQNRAMCVTELIYKSLDLINRQQAENKELKTENLILSQKRFNIFERIEFTDKFKKQAKSEAIKEFWEKLWELDPEIISKVVSFDLDELNNLKKEMVGEK